MHVQTLSAFFKTARKQSSGSATLLAVSKNLSAACAYKPSTSTTSSGPRNGAMSTDSFGVAIGSSHDPMHTVFPLAHASIPLALALTHVTPESTSFASFPTASTYTKDSADNATNDELFAHHFSARTGAASVISPNLSAAALPSLESRVA